MRTDLQIQKDVQEELKWQPNIKEAEIGVAVKNGVVTLLGTVDSFAQKLAAEHAVQYVTGVRAIAEELEVRVPLSMKRDDSEIAETALSTLKWNVSVPDTRIKLRVEGGWVTLEGEVDWQFQRTAAEECVRSLLGVKGISNMLLVRQEKATAFDVSQRIQDSFKRSATIDSQKIAVEAKNGNVVLKGKVRSWVERADAENAAWAAPGVTQVYDQLTVDSW